MTERNSGRKKEKTHNNNSKMKAKIRVNAGNAEKVDRNNAKRERGERLAQGLGDTVRREA